MAPISKRQIIILILMINNVFLINTFLAVVGLEMGNDSYNSYDLLLNDYYLRGIETSNVTREGLMFNDNKKTFLKTFLKKNTYNIKNDNCTDEDMNHINVKSVICLLKNISNPSHPSNIIFKRLRKVIQIWIFIYLITVLPLWCTRGWCCCCFCCKFLKPNETIEAAKKYLALNPPGILIDDRGKVIYYEPTVYEKESYERFEHLIRTI